MTALPLEARCSVTPLEALRRLIAVAKTADGMGFESIAHWFVFESELGVAEMVLRDAAPVAAQPAPATETVARFWNAVEARNHEMRPAMPKLPSTPEEVIVFIGGHFEVMDTIGDIEDRRITLSVHDLLSAFQNLVDVAGEAAQPVEVAGQDLDEGLTILDQLIDSIKKHGNYSRETTLIFLGQLRQCLAAPQPAESKAK